MLRLLFLYRQRLANLLIVQIKKDNTNLLAKITIFLHKLFPIPLAAPKALQITPSTKDVLTPVVELHVKSSNHGVFSKPESIIFSIVDFITDVVETFEAKVEFNAFVKFFVDSFVLVKISGFQDGD